MGKCGSWEAGIDNLNFIVDHEDLWMDQKTIAVLLGTTVGNVSKHLNKKFESGELSKEENEKNPNDTTNSCIAPINPEATTQPRLYNLDAIIAVAYSVNSKQAAKVRKWSNGINYWGMYIAHPLTIFSRNKKLQHGMCYVFVRFFKLFLNYC